MTCFDGLCLKNSVLLALFWAGDKILAWVFHLGRIALRERKKLHCAHGVQCSFLHICEVGADLKITPTEMQFGEDSELTALQLAKSIQDCSAGLGRPGGCLSSQWQPLIHENQFKLDLVAAIWLFHQKQVCSKGQAQWLSSWGVSASGDNEWVVATVLGAWHKVV